MHERHHYVKGHTSLLSQYITARLEVFLEHRIDFWASVKGSVHIFVFVYLLLYIILPFSYSFQMFIVCFGVLLSVLTIFLICF